MEGEEISMKWHCPYCETEETSCLGILEQTVIPKSMGESKSLSQSKQPKEETPCRVIPERTVVRYDEDEITVLPCRPQHISPENAVSAAVLHDL